MLINITADPDTITWFADAFSVVLKNPSIGKVTTGDLSYLPIDQNGSHYLSYLFVLLALTKSC